MTAQEAYTAKLAGDGRTKVEIGAQLFLSALCAGAAVITALFVSDSRTAAPALAPPPRCHGCALPVPGPVPDRAATT